MDKFKVGDWVKCLGGEIERVKFIDGSTIHVTNLMPPERECDLTKLHPKFDNFEELFSVEPPLPRLRPAPKYETCDEVVYYFGGIVRVSNVEDCYPEGLGWCYLIDDHHIPEEEVICDLDSIRGKSRQDHT